METIRTVIIEDQSFFAAEYAERILADSRFSLLKTYYCAKDTLLDAENTIPDIAIVDIGLPDMKGDELIKQLRLYWPNCQFLVCSVHDEDDTVFNAICSGATGYILKSATRDEFLQSIVDLHQGGSPMSFQIARKVLDFLRHKKQPTTEAEKLTPRELQIVEILSKGLRYKEIAAELDLSQETVRKHINNIYRKLQVQSRTDALNKLFPR